MRHQVAQLGLDPQRFGWASIQLDGGLERVTKKVVDWFQSRAGLKQTVRRQDSDLRSLTMGILSSGPIGEEMGQTMGGLARHLVEEGATVILPEHDGLVDQLVGEKRVATPPHPTIEYGTSSARAGLHIMANPGRDRVEALTGMAACGCSLILAAEGRRPQAGHPLVPVLRISAQAEVIETCGNDLDLALTGASEEWEERIIALVIETVSGLHTARSMQTGQTDVQFTRGLLGFSA